MSKIKGITIGELLDKGYSVRAYKHEYEDVENAVKDFEDILDVGSEVVVEGTENGVKWVGFEGDGELYDFDIAHFIKNEEKLKVDSKERFTI